MARRSWRELHTDEDGASMVFATITFFTISISIMFVFQVSLVSTDRIQMQNAADAAAYSGALVEANSLNAIGQVNDAMAYLHYTLLRYTVDSIVYRTLEEFTEHQTWSMRQPQKPRPNFQIYYPSDPKEQGQQPPSVPDEVMLGDDAAWKRHLKRVEENEGLIAQGTEWLKDLHAVGRLIVKATPRLVREAVIDVARRNGATHVALSEDIDKAFRTTGSGAGFVELSQEGASVGDTKPAPQQVWRYAIETLKVDGEPRDYPSWFSPFEGTNTTAYSQARVCWDAMDWAHSQRAEGHALTEDGGVRFLGNPMGIAPNGHWHHRHSHWMENLETGATYLPGLHGGTGGGTESSGPFERPIQGGGHRMDDMIYHNPAGLGVLTHMTHVAQFISKDHAIIRCPTCWGHTSLDANKTPGAQYGAVVVNSDQPEQRFTHAPSDTDHFKLKLPSPMPRPLGITADLLRSGITVVTYRPGFGLADLLPASPWGTVAVASAQVGLIQGDTRDGGPVLLLEQLNGRVTYKVDGTDADGLPLSSLAFDLKDPTSNEPPTFSEDGQANYRNLYFHHDFKKGLRFGARLVPVARPYTWHKDLEGGAGLDALIGKSIGGERWFRVDDAVEPTPETPEIGALSDFLGVDGPNSLEEALWH